MDKKTILVIEDEPTINRIISKYFRKEGYNVLSALDGLKGLEVFHKNKIDLVCLDIMMPNINGWEVSKTIRETSNIPIILMSALSEEEDILKGFSLKVDDYVTKPFKPSVLIAKIKSLFERIDIERQFNAIEGTFDIEGINFELATFEKSDALRELLTHDELTGVANRRYLDFHIENLLKQARDFNNEFGLLFVDIDHFKHVNDTYGHNVGDVCLKELSSIIKKSIRNNDVIGRWGGEEFLVIIQVEDVKHLTIIAEKLRSIVEDYRFDKSDTDIKLTISVGGTMCVSDDSSESLIKRADGYMYSSKNTGRNKITIK